MTPESLREHLQGFHRLHAGNERAAWGGARLAPLPVLDDEFSDLFRDQTRAEVRVAFAADPGRHRRWQGFVDAGCRRRRCRDERRELQSTLQVVRPGDMGPAAEAAMEQAMALAAAGGSGPPDDPAGEGDAVARTLTAHRAALEDCRRGLERDAELVSEALPADRQDDLWRHLTDAPGYLRRGDGMVRMAAASESGCLPEAIPQLIHLIFQQGSGLAVWEGQLRAAGTALALAHMPGILAAEDRWLPGDGGAGIYGCLWARRLLDPSWLATMGITGDAQEAVAGQMRRRLAARLLVLADAVVAAEAGPPPPGWNWLAAWPAAPAAAMAHLCGLPTAPAMLHHEHMAALLEHGLLRRFGHDWDRSRRGADLLRQLWSEGWARSLTELLSLLGESDPHGDVLMQIV